MDEYEGLSEIFDERQAPRLLEILKQVEEKSAKRATDEITARLAEEGIVDDEMLALTKPKHNLRDVQVRKLKQVWENSGVHPQSNRRYSLNDMIEYSLKATKVKDVQFSTDNPLLIQQVVTEFVREAVEPNLVLTDLFVPMKYQHGTRITFPATSAFYAREISESLEFPEMELTWAGFIEATVGRVGLAVKFSDDAIKYSMFDLMAYHLREAGKALARYKEEQAATVFAAAATTDFDPDNALPTSGMDFAGARNGTFTIDDLLTMVANAVTAGWTPNALVVHPMAWLIFARDPIMQALAFANGNAPYLQAFQGQAGNNPKWKGGGLVRPHLLSDPGQVATTYTPVTNVFPVPLRIIVSPFVGYDATTQKTDIYLVDTNEIGYNVIEEGVTSETWRDPAHMLEKTRFMEKYSMVQAIEPHIRAAKNISIAKAYDWQNRSVWQAGTGAAPTS